MSSVTDDDLEELSSDDSDSESVDLPKSIELSSYAVEIDCHPTKDVLAAGTEKGPVKIYSYTADKLRSNHELMSFRHHRESCRAVQFSGLGDYLFTGSSDKTIHAIDLDAGAVVRRLKMKDGAAIYSLLSISNYLLASGADDGQITIWDFRRALPIVTFKPCVEYISCLKLNSEQRSIMAASGEGSVFVFDLRAQKLQFQSQLYKDEFVTAAIIKNETKVVVGASEGVMYIFNWGEWSEVNQKFPCNSGSIDVIVASEDNVICAGCEDGHIRAVEISPNRVLGSVGMHSDFPVEGLCITHDRQYIASCSYDGKIKFHDMLAVKRLRCQMSPTGMDQS